MYVCTGRPGFSLKWFFFNKKKKKKKNDAIATSETLYLSHGEKGDSFSDCEICILNTATVPTFILAGPVTLGQLIETHSTSMLGLVVFYSVI